MAAQTQVEILLQARDEASKVLKSAGDEMSSLGKGMDFVKGNVAQFTAAFAGVVGVIGTSIAAFAESQDGVAQLDAVLKSTNGTAGVTKDVALDLAAAWQQQSKFSDDAILSAENMLLTFTNIGKDVFPQATETVLNMSQALGQDLKNSSIQLGKALNDPIAGITALSRVGVTFTDTQKEQIKTLVEAGDRMGAQKIILKELSTEFGGSAKAAAETFSGQLTILKNNFGDLQETMGKGFLDALDTIGISFEDISNALINLNTFLTEHKAVLMGVVAVFLILAVTLGAIVVAAFVAMAGTAGLVIGAIGLIVAVVVAAAVAIIEFWTPISTFFSNLWQTVVNAFNTAVSFIMTNVIQPFIDFFMTYVYPIFQTFFQLIVLALILWVSMWLDRLIFLRDNVVKPVIEWFMTYVYPTIQNVFKLIQGAVKVVVDWFNTYVAPQIKNAFTAISNAVEALRKWFQDKFDEIKNKVNEVINFVTNLINNFKPKIDIGINLPNIEQAWKDLKNKAHNLGIPGFQTGGIVPGAIGQPQLIMAHGGETITPAGVGGSGQGSGSGLTIQVNVGLYAGTQTEKRNIAQELYAALVEVAQSQNKSVKEFMGA